MRIDKRTELFDWLENNATESRVQNCYGEGFDMYKVPFEKARDFYKVYLPALLTEDGKWEEWECSGCKRGDVIDGVIGMLEHNDDTEFLYRLRGSDYDTGIYEPGPSGKLKCKGWLRFYDGQYLTLYYDRVFRREILYLSHDLKQSKCVVVFV